MQIFNKKKTVLASEDTYFPNINSMWINKYAQIHMVRSSHVKKIVFIS